MSGCLQSIFVLGCRYSMLYIVRGFFDHLCILYVYMIDNTQQLDYVA